MTSPVDRNCEAEDDMGLSKIRIGIPALVVAALLLGGAFQAAAQSFGGMSMLDVEAERDSFFQSADADGDFALSTDEQLSAIHQQHAKLLECWDGDADGLCSYSEFLESGQKLFSELDVNGDGLLDAEEVQ